MDVEWAQHPAGHGGFHTGRARFDRANVVNWIYDCGARSSKKFDKVLTSWISNNTFPVDWLFISHFDTDHVSGLDTLLSGTVVNNVMVPFVNDDQLAFTLLHEIRRGRLQRSFVELVSDPAQFFLSRGVGRVTFLGGPESSASEEPTEPTPIRPVGWETRELTVKMTPLPTPLPAPATKSGPEKEIDNKVEIVNQNGCEIYVSDQNTGLLLKPYRTAINTSSLRGLRTALYSLLGISSRAVASRPGLGRLAHAVALHARTSSGRSDLQKVFKLFVGSSNRASLSLLSVPVQVGELNKKYRHFRWNRAFEYDVPHFPAEWPPAWLNTGDSELLHKADLDAFAAAYAGYLPSVHMLALPHHGSDFNSDIRLQNLCPNAALVVHVKEGAKKHPGPVVTGLAGGRLLKVTNARQSVLRASVYFS